MALLPGCFTEDVLFNREACGVPGEKEEDIINHGLLKAGREKPGLGGMRTELKRRIFTPPILAVALVEGAFLDICPDTC